MSAVGQVASAMTGQMTGAVAPSVLNPITLGTAYSVNQGNPNVQPSPQDALHSYYAHQMSLTTLTDVWQKHGLSVEFDRWVFDPADWINGVATYSQNYHGRPSTRNEMVARSFFPNPSVFEANEMLNRGLIDRPLHTHFLLSQCGNSPALMRAWGEMRWNIPGPSDLVRFAVRDCFDPVIVETFGYHRETPLAIKPWMFKQGFGQSTGLQVPVNGTDSENNHYFGDASWFDLYWWSHWDLPSPTQGFEMMHRLYATSDYGPSPDIIDNQTFGQGDLNLLLKANDYPEFWRTRLTAISYHPITRTDASWLYENSLMDDAGFYHTLRGLGYNDENAKLYLKGQQLRKDRSMRVEPAKVTKQWICKYYSLGIITWDQAVELLTKNGYSRAKASRFVEVCELEVKSTTVSELLKHIRMAYIRGLLSEEEMENQLIQSIPNGFIRSEYRKRWQYAKFIKYKQPAARMAITYYKNGVIDIAELQTRLFNLGYDARSITLMIVNANRELAIQKSKAIEKSQKEATKKALEIAKQIKAEQKEKAKELTVIKNQLKKDHQETINGIIKNSTDKNIVDWYEKNLIELWSVYYRLYHRDFTISDAESWVVSRLSETTKEERNNASKKAQTIYAGEPNPPLVP